MIFVFLPSYLSSDVMRGRIGDGFVDEYAYTINCINSIIFLPIVVLIGYYTDRVGTMPFISVSTFVIALLSPFLFYGLAMSTSSYMNWFLQFVLVLCCVPLWGCIFYWYINKLLPDPRTRVTIYGVGYNLGAAFFGGTASLIATTFVEETGAINGMILSGIWMSVMAVLCVGTVFYTEFCERPMDKKENDQNNVPIEKAGIKGYYQNSFTSTWHLNPKYRTLDTIDEAGESNDEDNDGFNSSEENDISTYDQHKSPKRYG